MYGSQYNDLYKAQLKRYQERLNEKMQEELKKEKPDLTKLNQLKQAKYLTPVFDDNFGTFERFRNPW